MIRKQKREEKKRRREEKKRRREEEKKRKRTCIQCIESHTFDGMILVREEVLTEEEGREGVIGVECDQTMSYVTLLGVDAKRNSFPGT